MLINFKGELDDYSIDQLESISYEKEMIFGFNDHLLIFSKVKANIWNQKDYINTLEIRDKVLNRVLLFTSFTSNIADEFYQSTCYDNFGFSIQLNELPNDSCMIMSTYVDNENLGIIFRNMMTEVKVVINFDEFEDFLQLFYFYYLVDIE